MQRRPKPSDYVDIHGKSDRTVKIVDGALIIKNIQKAHEAYYLCKASNGIGGISAVAKLSVQGIENWCTSIMLTFAVTESMLIM